MKTAREKMRGTSASADWGKLAAVQAASGENLGGGGTGSNEVTEFCGPAGAISGSKCATTEIVAGTGSTKMAGATAGGSELWQQDMLHWAIVDIPWPQSMACS